MKDLGCRFGIVILVLVAGYSTACSQQRDLSKNTTASETPTSSSPDHLMVVADVPLTGRATRLDYQSFDPQNGRLYIAHLGDSMLTVFDTRAAKLIGDIKDLKSVHGVLAVPELHRIYASATGTNELAVIDDQSLAVVARIPTGDYPDGIAYAANEKKLYVSNLHGRSDTVIDATTNKPVGMIALSGQPVIRSTTLSLIAYLSPLAVRNRS